MDHEEIPYPVAMYRDRLRAEHEHNTEEAFEKLVRDSGVDREANAALVKKIRKREKQIDSLNSTLAKWRFLRGIFILLILAGAAGITLAGFQLADRPLIDYRLPPWLLPACIGGVILFLILIFKGLNPKIRAFELSLKEQQEILRQELNEAWEQMASLNRLFQWDTVSRIVMKTLPIVKIDQYFANVRMDQLVRYFHWEPGSDSASSILCCQSGTLNGNPWVLAERLKQVWGTKTYYGSITISWEERVSYTDSNGKTQTRWETRYETLTASVEKPEPQYEKVKFLLYGNEAAPELTFSREPNSLSSIGKGFFGRMRLKSAIKALEKKSRDLDSGFMITDNREFDACFNAVDRNNEQQFRLLFTVLAQQEMLTLLRDQKEGFGDDFTFIKQKMINCLYSDHLDQSDFSGDPTKFCHYEFAEIRRIFLDYSRAFFRNFYFTMAPLFCIPLYQQHRSFPDIYQGIIDKGEPAEFEYESLVNAMEEKIFRPEQAVTRCILKPSVTVREGSATQLSVTAYAFRGEERTDYIPVYGGDRKVHQVPVHWIEYLPVSRQRNVSVCEAGTSDQEEFRRQQGNDHWRSIFTRWDAVSDSVIFRRGLVAFLQNK